MIKDIKAFGLPTIHVDAFISERASVIGDVVIEEEVIVAPLVCIRADEGTPFKICRGTNIQDLVIMHGLLGRYVMIDGKKYSIHIGSHCSIAHRALIHGPTDIGNKTFIGFNATIHNSVIGRECYIGHGAIVEGVVIGDGRYVRNGMVVDSQEIADVLPFVPSSKKDFNKEVVDYNKLLRGRYDEHRKLQAAQGVGK